MKYPPRNQQHPEVLSTGPFTGALLTAIRMHAHATGRPIHSSGQLQATLEALGDDDITHGAMMFALLHWVEGARPIYYMDEGLATTLTNTEIPMERFDLPLWVPDNGMYIVLPPIFTIESVETGQHEVEGVYLVKDKVAVLRGADGKPDFTLAFAGEKHLVVSDDEAYLMVDAITIIGLGKSKGLLHGIKEMRDDAVVTFHLIPGQRLGAGATHNYGGIDELERVVSNLLYALHNTTSVVKDFCTPSLSEKAAKRRPGRAEKLLEQSGKTLAPYTVLRLNKNVRSARVADTKGTDVPVRKLKHPKLIPGHFHRYWVLDATDERVLETKDGKGGKLHLIEHLLAPYLQGANLPETRDQDGRTEGLMVELDLLVDLDGVSADFEKRRYDLLRSRGLPAVPPSEVTDFYGIKAYTREGGARAAHRARAVKKEAGFFSGMEPVPGALKGLRYLESRGHHVRICSKPLEAHPNCTAEKLEWVEKHLGLRWAEDALIIKEKSLVKADALIDDRPDLYAYTIGRKEAEPVWKHVLFAQPWNRESTVQDFDMNDWNDFRWLEWLEGIVQPPKDRRR